MEDSYTLCTLHCKYLGMGLHILREQSRDSKCLVYRLNLESLQRKCLAHKTKVVVQEEGGSAAVAGSIT